MTCKEFENLMFDFIEGHLTFRKKRALKNHLKHCSKCQTALNQYENLVVKLHQVPQLNCPDAVVESVLDSIAIEEKREPVLTRTYEFILERFSLRLSFAAAFVVIILIAFIFYPVQQKMESTYTAEELEQAKKDVELALGYFNFYAKKTEGIIEKEVFSKPIITPIKSTVKMAFKPLLNGGKI